MAASWIKLHRRSIDSRVFSDDFLWRLWCWCLMSANWKSRWKDGCEIKSGQFTTGRNQAADQLNVSPSKWYRGMHKLQEWGQITIEVNSKWTTVTICKWETYQSDPPGERTASEQPVNSEWTASEQPVNTPKERQEGLEGEEEKTLVGVADATDGSDGDSSGGADPPKPDPETERLADLLDWIGWWNGLHAQGLVTHGVNELNPSKAVVDAHKRLSKSAILRMLCSRRDEIEAEIRAKKYLQTAGWLGLEKIFGGKNSDGELIVRKILDRRYGEKFGGGGKQMALAGPGQKYDPNVEPEGF